jgi:acetylornithine deacetylase/succinyl-diaminopimelate desuccinylase-like protein
MHDDLRAAVDEIFPRIRMELEALVRIPSVSADGFDPANVRRSAEATAALLERTGLEGVRLLEVDGAHPAVFGERHVSADAPTVLLYAHHDVQPPGDESQWQSPPFEVQERDGRLYGRGASDDKAGIAAHVAAISVHGENLPVNVKVFVEGEEEIGSAHLSDFLADYGDLLAADVIVVADAANWRAGTPALTTTLRGIVELDVEVQTLEHGVHSGIFGGAFPDALMVLSRLLASLHHDDGSVAVEGLDHGEAEPLDLTEDELRGQAGAVDGVALLGSGTLTGRTWTKPAISILKIEAPGMDPPINQLLPLARAKVSVRLAPSDDTARAMDAVQQHLETHVPWGARVTVTPGASGAPFALQTSGPGYDAFRQAFAETWARPSVEIGIGGSIPFVASFAAAFPRADILLTAVGDPGSRIHGPNESQDLADLKSACLAEAVALRLLAEAHS